MTPLKSIRLYCLWCSGNFAPEVRKCPKKDCIFYTSRMGRKGFKGPVAKMIRKRCEDCGEGTYLAIKNCEFPDCPLYACRMGKNKNLIRKGNNGSNLISFRYKGGLAATEKAKN